MSQRLVGAFHSPECLLAFFSVYIVDFNNQFNEVLNLGIKYYTFHGVTYNNFSQVHGCVIASDQPNIAH